MVHSNAVQVLLVLAALAFICNAQRDQGGDNCLCSTFRSTVDSKKSISEIQIFPQTEFCNQIEIIITNKQGRRYCLNPTLPAAKKFLRIIQSRR